ncbi:MAG: hypothetical protein M1334_03015 [Patescibacteria group bacterium]|nr:hypothetical protein [Patescibacteria group bacterium]
MKEGLIGKNKKSGQSTLEIIIALGIIVISLSAVVVVIYGGQSIAVDAQLSGEALSLARQNLEISQAQSINNFNGLNSSTGTSGIYNFQITVTSTSAYVKKITSNVSWQTDPLRVQSVTLNTLVTDWNAYKALGGDTGGTGLAGDWLHPQTLGKIDLGPGSSATGLDVLNGIVYMSSVSSDVKKPDFWIINATNGLQPGIVSSLDIGPGLNAVDVAGNYAYVANSSTTNQLQIINVSNLNDPYLAASLTLSGVSGNGAVGNSIFYYGNKVYMGTENANGPEFHIIDVSNPQNPVELGNFNIGASVNGIYINNGIAYLATGSSQELQILNISNPSNISQLGSFSPAGCSVGQSLFLVNETLYFGCAGGTNNFFILDVSSPSSVRQLGATNTGGSVNSMYIRDYLAFLGTSNPNEEFQAWNISSSTNPIFWSSYNFPEVATGIDYENNFVYASVRSNDALRIITSSP